MEIKDEVAHIISGKKGEDRVRENMVIEVSTHHNLIAHINPGGEVSFKVFQKCCAWVSVVILVIQILLMLLVDCGFSSQDGAICSDSGFNWAVDTHHPQDYVIPASISCPAPAAQTTRVSSSSHSIFGDGVLGDEGCASPLGVGVSARVSVVGSGCLGSGAQVVPGDLGEVVVLMDNGPVDAHFLDGSNGDIVAGHGAEEFIILGGVFSDGESVHVAAENAQGIFCRWACPASPVGWLGRGSGCGSCGGRTGRDLMAVCVSPLSLEPPARGAVFTWRRRPPRGGRRHLGHQEAPNLPELSCHPQHCGGRGCPGGQQLGGC